ncbi:MAG: hypothetical protein A2Z04_06685 [Chloroflexi bacterium RBG_16_57_9]|nr:MAG: hypothetical protein A2Z04_06685 [Chloroflexi bacterium RBG_16_57_9]
MHATKAQIRADIQQLFSELAIFGVNRPAQLAALLRDSEGEDPTFPSDAYIRLMMSPREEPAPGKAFCDRIYALKDYVADQLRDGAPDLARVCDDLVIRDRYDPTRLLRFARVPVDYDFGQIVTADPSEHDSHLVLALIPANLIRICNHCGIAYPGVPQSRYCKKDCRRDATKERRRQRKEREQYGKIYA